MRDLENQASPELKWRRECPRFNGAQAEYKEWKGASGRLVGCMWR